MELEGCTIAAVVVAEDILDIHIHTALVVEEEQQLSAKSDDFLRQQCGILDSVRDGEYGTNNSAFQEKVHNLP